MTLSLREIFMKEASVNGYYGTTKSFDKFDIRKTIEFGLHFGIDDVQQSLHRIAQTGGELYKVSIMYSKALPMQDMLRWNLENVLRQLGYNTVEIKQQRIKASQTARKNNTNLRVEENVLLAEILNEKGYDAILYDNMGESGGKAIIVWDPKQVKIVDRKTINPS